MPIAKGSKSRLLWREEAAFNTLPAASAYQGLSFSSESLVENINKIVSDEIRSDRQVPSIRGGNIMTGGSISTDFAPIRHMDWLRHLLAGTATSQVIGHTASVPDITAPVFVAATYARGTVVFVSSGGAAGRLYTCVQGGVVTSDDVTTSLTSTSGQESLTNTTWEFLFLVTNTSVDGVAQTVITPGVDYPTAGIVFEKQILGQTSPLYVQFLGCRINTFTLNIQQEGIVKADWGFLGMRSAKAAVSNATSVVQTVDDPFTGYEAFLSINGSHTARPVKEGTLTITNNVEENVFAWGSRFRRDLPGNRREVNGSITVYFEDHTEYDLFKQETTVAFDLSLCRQGKFVNFHLGEVKLTGQGTPSVSGQGVITAQFAFDAFVQGGANDVIVTILNNENAAL